MQTIRSSPSVVKPMQIKYHFLHGHLEWGDWIHACCFTEWSAYTEGREREEEETGHCRLGGSFNLGGLSRWVDLHTRAPQTQKSVQRPWQSCDVFSTADANTIIPSLAFSRLCPCKWLPPWEWWAERIFQGQGRNRGASKCLGQAHWPTSGYFLLMTSSSHAF